MREFRKLSTGEQAAWVGKYFAAVAKWRYPGDTYVATAASSAVGKPNDFIVYKNDPAKTADAWDLNKLWDINKDEQITAGELRQVLLTRMKKAPSGGVAPAPIPKADRPPASFGEFLEQFSSALRSDAAARQFGRFGPSATRVIRDYQTSRGIHVDGSVGPETFGKLRTET